jgi:hypothetical protein
MNSVLEYLLGRVDKLGTGAGRAVKSVCRPRRSIRERQPSGNRNDPGKLLRVTAELSAREAILPLRMKARALTYTKSPILLTRQSLQVLRPRRAAHLQHHGRSEYSHGGAKLRMSEATAKRRCQLEGSHPAGTFKSELQNEN